MTNHLPRTSAEATSIQPGTMTIDAFHEVVDRMQRAGASPSAIRGMARIIASHGQKYTAEAREYAAAYAVAGEPT